MADPKRSRTTLFTPETGCGISPDDAHATLNKVNALSANAARANNLTPDPFKETAVRILNTCSGAIEHAIHPELKKDASSGPTL